MTAPDTSAPPLDLDAIEARIAACARLCAWEEGDGCREVATQRCAGGNCGLRLCEAHAEAHSNEAAHDTYPLPRNAVPEARDLLAEARRLRGMLDATAQAYDELMAQVWRATGETHEPPADVAALLRRVADDHKALAGFRRVMFDVCEALDGERPEPDYDAPAELGAWACDEVARLKARRSLPVACADAGCFAHEGQTCAEGEMDPRNCPKADAVALRREVERLTREAAAARREGAAVMRDRIERVADEHGFGDVVRAVPMPRGEP